MMPSSTSTTRRRATSRRVITAAATLASLALLSTACSAAGAAPGSAPASLPPQPAEYSSVPTPGPPIDTTALAGKTVYWIPITSQAPIFSIEQAAAEEAFAAAGVELQVCDGQATPAAVSQCVNQAIAADAGGIIATSIPPEFAQQSFGAAVAAGIPVQFVNTKDATVPAEWGDLAAALPANFNQQATMNSDIIIADSGGKANVLLIGVTDSSVTTSVYEQGMQGYLSDKCPGCTIDSVQVGSTQLASLSSLASAALVKNPNTEYIFVEFDSFAAPVVQAIRQLNKQDSIKLVTMLGALDGVQRVADGDAFADTGYSVAALGWNEADVMLRMMAGQDPLIAAHRWPIKTFTAANVDGLDLTEAGWKSGKWQSDDDFRAMFTELWTAGAEQ